MADPQLPLLRGTLDLLVLRTLAWQPMHGYAVASWVRERTDGVLELEDAPLYKALHRLEDGGAIAAEWGVSEINRRAKYYSLTAAGRRQLTEQRESWARFSGALAAILGTT